MAYYGIDLERAQDLANALRRVRADVAPIEQLILDGELLADLPTGCGAELERIGDDAGRSASEIDVALAIVEGFRLRLSGFAAAMVHRHTGTSAGAIAPRWDAEADRPWNEVHQVASHNTYRVPGGIAALHRLGVRSFELDIHRGAPTRILRHVAPWSGVQTIVAIAADAVDHGPGRPGDWRVYHDSTSAASEYGHLSDGLIALASVRDTEPLTVFVDNKDGFGGDHSGEAFDALLEQVFGARLFGPAELRARAPRAETLHDAVEQAGWPTVAELDGRVIVVLTDEIGGYDRRDGRAFVAPRPTFAEGEGGALHLPEHDAVFYNADARRMGSAELAAVQATGSVIRTYFGPRCGDGPAIAEPNYRAVDVLPGRTQCAATTASSEAIVE